MTIYTPREMREIFEITSKADAGQLLLGIENREKARKVWFAMERDNVINVNRMSSASLILFRIYSYYIDNGEKNGLLEMLQTLRTKRGKMDEQQ